ncbi:WYL domain-containing protein [Desulfurivibrio alkaliphilus]|uniref:WYL domain-containing protein n=1 Tax=Desulfurivibrio alkaliphilus TaxID=427923 RepID=UPI002478CF6E|nr:WYL domain-containing protein [Desulfurivibrio alkaliphilus]
MTNHTEIMMQTLRYGHHVEVLAPPELRRRVVEEIRRMGGVYGGVSNGAGGHFFGFGKFSDGVGHYMGQGVVTLDGHGIWRSSF